MDRGSIVVVRACGFAAVLLAALALRVKEAAFPFDAAVFAASLCVAWAGVCLRWWCSRTLGRYFTLTVMVSPGQPVIRAGPYRFLRHPSYLGILLVLAGLGLTYGNWLSLAVLILLPFGGLINRIHVEEAALSAALGPAYASYAATRKRLIPFVW